MQPAKEDRAEDAARAQPDRRPRADLTQGPIASTLLTFMLPVLGANILQSLNGSANAFWVSHVLGEVALTATANANQVLFLMMGVMFGISMAANILIGQAFGAGDHALTSRVVGACTTFFIVVSVSLGLLGGLLTPTILDAMGTPADARPDAIAYLRVIFAAMPFMYFFAFLMMAQRGVGDSRTPFYFALLQVTLDVVFNPLLIMGVGPFPRLGIAGSATSTLVSHTIALAVMLTYLYRKRSPLVLRPNQARLLLPDMEILRTLVFKGMPMGFQMIVMSLASVTMMSAVNRFGSPTAAAYGAAQQLWNYIQMPGMALGAAVSAMAAQNVGARRIDRVERIAGSASALALALTVAPILAVLAAERYVLLAFLPVGSPSIAIAQHLNMYVLWSFAAFSVSFVISSVVRATGVVWPPLLFMIVALWGVRIPFAWALTPRLGADAVWLSFPLGSVVLLSFAASYYRWGNWRSARLLKPKAEPVVPAVAAADGVAEALAEQAPT